MSTPEQTLTHLLTPVLEPLIQFQKQARHLMSIHHDVVYQFRLAATSLTAPGTDLLKGEAAKAFDSLVSEYLSSEARFTGAGTPVNSGVMEEADVACATLEQDIVHSIYDTSESFLGHFLLFQMLEQVTEAIDISAALQGFIDIPDDAIAGILTAVDATIMITELSSFLVELFQEVQRWQNKIQSLADQPLPSLPPTPTSVSKPIPLFHSNPIIIPASTPTP